MRFLLKPGWVIFILVVIGFAVACYTLLAPWQFRRNAERELQNQAIAASYAHPPRPYTELVPGPAPEPGIQWRQAVVRGEYLPDAEAVVRLRTVKGRPAFEVLTAFRTEDGRTIAVNRGFVRPGGGQQVADYPPAPTGPVELTGRIRLDETDSRDRPPLTVEGHQQIYAADSRQLARVTGLQLTGGYLQLNEGQPGVLEPLPLPELESGPFLSYAWQWLAFGAMALIGLGYFIRLEILQRRAAEESHPSGEPSDSEDSEIADRLSERYGKARS